MYYLSKRTSIRNNYKTALLQFYFRIIKQFNSIVLFFFTISSTFHPTTITVLSDTTSISTDWNNTYQYPSTTLVVPLFGKHQSHHVYMYIGSPPQRKLLIVDTGSRILSLPCEPCEKCGKHHVSKEYFNPNISFTDRSNDCDECVFEADLAHQCAKHLCTYKQAFAEGSKLTGYELDDIVWFGSEHLEESIGYYMFYATPYTFGCQTSESGLFAKQYADGIIGLSYHYHNLIHQMHHKGIIANSAFSMCLTRTSGLLSIGGVYLSFYPNESSSLSSSSPRHLQPMHIVPMTKNHGWYAIQIKSIRLGHITLTPKTSATAADTTTTTDDDDETLWKAFNDGKGTIIDSGTTDTYLPSVLYKSFTKAWKQLTQFDHSNTKQISLSYTEFQNLPTITLILEGGYEWMIRPFEYMEEVKQLLRKNVDNMYDDENEWVGTKSFINRIYITEDDGCVLGANAMYGHDILFDLENRMIGISRSVCT